MVEPLKARPSINGNSRADFCDAHEALLKASEALSNAMRILAENVTHGRNYQNVAQPDAAIYDDKQAAHRPLREAHDTISKVAARLCETILLHDNN